ncbi:MAG: hypothetical protein LJE95_07055 [Acidobacteria bacterium]|nr:hypothetical protein [Acidobacteriota bacterium]
MKRFRITVRVAVLLLACVSIVSQAVAQDSPPGKGITDPKEWMKDWAKNRLKDAAFGTDVSVEFHAIFDGLPESVKRAQTNLGKARPHQKPNAPCRWAALNQTWWAAFNLSKARPIQGAGKTLFNILDDLLTLGSGGLEKFIGSKGESFVRAKIAKKLAGKPPRGYKAKVEPKKGCSMFTKTIWDPAKGIYQFSIAGICRCNKVQTGKGTDTVHLKAFIAIFEGTARVPYKKGQKKLKAVFGPAHLVHLSADCACSGKNRYRDAQLSPPKKNTKTAVGGGSSKAKPLPTPSPGCAKKDCLDDLKYLKEIDQRTDLDNYHRSMAGKAICDHFNQCDCDKQVTADDMKGERLKLFAKYCVAHPKPHPHKDRRTGYLGPPNQEGEPVSDTTGAATEAVATAGADAGAVEIRVGGPGQPVPGAKVGILRGEVMVSEKRTDSTGTVSLPLSPGSYTVAVDSGAGPVESGLDVASGRLSSYTTHDGTLTASDTPLPQSVTPADTAVEKGYAFSYREQNDLVTIDFSTPEGMIYVSAPGQAVAGSPVSWGVTLAAAGTSPKKMKKNTDKIQRYAVRAGGTELPLADGDVLHLTAAGQVNVALIRKGKVVASGTVPFDVMTGAPETTASAGIPSALAGDGFTLAGAFDGNSGNTRLEVGGKPLRVAAESTLGVSFYTPAGNTGPVWVTATEDSTVTNTTLRILGLDFWADRTHLLRGQHTTAHIRVRGLAGIERPVFLALANRTPGIISLSPADAQLVVITPGATGDEDDFKIDRGMVGVTPGSFWITAAVTAP